MNIMLVGGAAKLYLSVMNYRKKGSSKWIIRVYVFASMEAYTGASEYSLVHTDQIQCV